MASSHNVFCAIASIEAVQKAITPENRHASYIKLAAISKSLNEKDEALNDAIAACFWAILETLDGLMGQLVSFMTYPIPEIAEHANLDVAILMGIGDYSMQDVITHFILNIQHNPNVHQLQNAIVFKLAHRVINGTLAKKDFLRLTLNCVKHKQSSNPLKL